VLVGVPVMSHVDESVNPPGSVGDEEHDVIVPPAFVTFQAEIAVLNVNTWLVGEYEIEGAFTTAILTVVIFPFVAQGAGVALLHAVIV